ncbi:MAG: hypothetical protein ACREO5_07895, partial [Candidatus Binatia bacterium]
SAQFARYTDKHGIIEDFPAAVLGNSRELALLFKHLAPLRTETPSSTTSAISAVAARCRIRRVCGAWDSPSIAALP